MCRGLGEVPDLEPLTERQRQVMGAINTFTHMIGRPPTLRQLADHLGLRSQATVHEHVHNLAKAGYLAVETARKGSVGIRLVES